MMVNFCVAPGKYWTTFSQPKQKKSPKRMDFFRNVPTRVKSAV